MHALGRVSRTASVPYWGKGERRSRGDGPLPAPALQQRELGAVLHRKALAWRDIFQNVVDCGFRALSAQKSVRKFNDIRISHSKALGDTRFPGADVLSKAVLSGTPVACPVFPAFTLNTAWLRFPWQDPSPERKVGWIESWLL